MRHFKSTTTMYSRSSSLVRTNRKRWNFSHLISRINSIISRHHSGHTSTVFNSMATIQVGGKVPKTGGRVRIERAFAGVIAGLSVNRIRVLDLASERDPQITIRGDVQLVTGVLDRNDLQSRMQQVRKFFNGNFNFTLVMTATLQRETARSFTNFILHSFHYAMHLLHFVCLLSSNKNIFFFCLPKLIYIKFRESWNANIWDSQAKLKIRLAFLWHSLSHIYSLQLHQQIVKNVEYLRKKLAISTVLESLFSAIHRPSPCWQ